METNPRMLEEIAENERWLASFQTPPADARLRARLRAAAHRELESARGATGSASRRRSWQGALAAAAMLLLAVCIGWYGVGISNPPDGAYFADAGTEEAILPSISATSLEQAEQFATLEYGMSDLEAWATEDRWAVSGASLYEALEEAFAANGDEGERHDGTNQG